MVTDVSVIINAKIMYKYTYAPGTGIAMSISTGPNANSVGPSLRFEFIISSHVTTFPVYADILPMMATRVEVAQASASL